MYLGTLGSFGIRQPYKRGWRASTTAATAAVSSLVAALVLAGCSIKARDTVSAASLEADIAGQLATSYQIPKPPVKCPRAVPAQVGSQFTCTATLDGQSLMVNGHVTGPHGRVEVKPAAAVVVTKAAERDLSKRLERTFHQAVALKCRAPALLVATPGRSFGCTATVGTIERQLVVSVTGHSGTLSYRVLPYRRPR